MFKILSNRNDMTNNSCYLHIVTTITTAYYNILTSLMSQLRYILHSLLKVYINELDVYEATINKVVFKVLIKVYII